MNNRITAHLGNFNGMRNRLDGKGRIEITVGSILACFPEVVDMDFRIIDNYSQDGSWEYINGLPLGRKERVRRIHSQPPWMATTINNIRNLRRTVRNSQNEFVWNIENDSYFFNNGDILERAIEALDRNPDISLIHLRRWTKLDNLDLPGVPFNLSRYSEKRISPSGEEVFVMEKRPEYALWVPVGDSLNEDFEPDDFAEYGKCPIGIKSIGAIRRAKDGTFERLLTEHWNSYTSHGWIARRKDLKFLFDQYDPKSERQMSVAYKEHFKSAKLSEDAFVDFGWKARYIPNEEEVFKLFEEVREKRSSFPEFGKKSPNFQGEEMEIPYEQLNVYK